jgi:hypothetical protein
LNDWVKVVAFSDESREFPRVSNAVSITTFGRATLAARANAALGATAIRDVTNAAAANAFKPITVLPDEAGFPPS